MINYVKLSQFFLKVLKKISKKILDKKNYEKKQIEGQKIILSECLESLSEISFLYLGQAIQSEDYESVYNEICQKNAHLLNSFLKIAPVVYRYNNGKLDEIRWTTSFLRTKIDMLEKYIPINNNDKINKSLKKCCNECFETLIFLREQLNEISLEKYMHLLSFA